LHFGEEVADFPDATAVIPNLGLAIPVDTSVAYLAGALEKPVWILLPVTPDWRS
jgi:ADP-heptose:LPS heptosyltransferase